MKVLTRLLVGIFDLAVLLGIVFAVGLVAASAVAAVVVMLKVTP